MTTMNVLQISTVVCSFISLLLLLIALGSDYWLATSNSNVGLWKGCVFGVCGVVAPSDADNAVRAFIIIGMIAGACACAGICATFSRANIGSISLAKISAIANLCAGGCAMIAMSVFTALSSGSYGWSFGLGWAAFPLFLISGGLAFALKVDVQA